MYIESKILEKGAKTEKFSAGPIRPKPGPTFPRHVITDEKHVIRSVFSRDMINAPAKTIAIYRNI